MSQYVCAAGWDCVGAQVTSAQPLKCSDGMVCPGGNYSMAWCPEGSFCPSSGPLLGRPVKCTAGGFCPDALASPIPCPVASICNAGAKIYAQYLYIVIAAPVVIAVFAAFFRSLRAMHGRGRPRRRPEQATAAPDVGAVSDVELAAEPEAPRTLHVRFERLSVSVYGENNREQVVLKSVSGEFRPGQVTAVMGASGAGKTTLVNVLLGKLRHSGGRILVNGAEQAMSRYCRLMGFVPQDDVLLRSLTVRETLQHAAATRLRLDTSRAGRAAAVERTLATLQLTELADRLVGDELRRGLSRSERKRLNIGVELVAAPRVLFVDEPTTGLDARTSQELVGVLRRIAGAGVTVVAVLHQPRFEILRLCHEVLLLGKGGFVAFQGGPDAALEYFQGLGYTLEEGMNPADLFLDVLNCRAERDPAAPGGAFVQRARPPSRAAPPVLPPIGGPPRVPTTLAFLEEAAREHGVVLEEAEGGARPPSRGPPSPRGAAVDVGPERWGRVAPGESLGSYLRRSLRPEGRASSLRATPGFWRQLPLYFSRELRCTAHDPVYVVIGIVSMLLAGSSMAAGFNGRIRYLPRLPAEVVGVCPLVVRGRCAAEATVGIVPYYLGFYLTMILGAICAVAAVPTFANDRPVYYREVAAGCSAGAFFVAKCAFDVINIFIRAFIFCAFFVLMIGAPGGFWPWLGILFPLCWCAYGVGYIVACILPKERAPIVAAVAGVATVITSGLSPSLAQVKDRYGPMQVLWWVSFNRWSAEGMVILSLTEYAARGFDVSGPMAKQGYENGNYALDVVIPLLLGISHRVIAFLFLRYRHREKQR